MMPRMDQLNTRLRALGVLAAICFAAVAAIYGLQSATTSPPAALDAATVAKKADELLNAHVKVNGFSGSVLLASEGTPIIAKGYGYANIEWQIPNTPQTKF